MDHVFFLKSSRFEGEPSREVASPDAEGVVGAAIVTGERVNEIVG